MQNDPTIPAGMVPWAEDRRPANIDTSEPVMFSGGRIAVPDDYDHPPLWRDVIAYTPKPAPSDPVADEARARESETFLAQLRRVNLARYEAWVEGADAGIMFDALELGGEVGELLNVVKKLEREERGWRGSRADAADFADECADVMICLDKLARRRGVDLEAATIAKFNATSEKVGLPHMLAFARETSTNAACGKQDGKAEEPRTNAEIVEQANDLARRFYARRGYEVPGNYRFQHATHPHEVEAWDMAVQAMEILTGTDAQEAADDEA